MHAHIMASSIYIKSIRTSCLRYLYTSAIIVPHKLLHSCPFHLLQNSSCWSGGQALLAVVLHCYIHSYYTNNELLPPFQNSIIISIFQTYQHQIQKFSYESALRMCTSHVHTYMYLSNLLCLQCCVTYMYLSNLVCFHCCVHTYMYLSNLLCIHCCVHTYMYLSNLLCIHCCVHTYMYLSNLLCFHCCVHTYRDM